jgi:hypothetical protein
MPLTEVDFPNCKLNKIVNLNMDYSVDLETSPTINGVQYLNVIDGGSITIQEGTNPDRVEISQNSISILNPINGRSNTFNSLGELNLNDLDSFGLRLTPLQLLVNGGEGTANQVLKKNVNSNVMEWGSLYPQIVVIDLSANYTITGINNPVYNLWAKTSAAGQQTIFLPTTDMTLGQTIIIRSEADSSSINSGTGNLIYRSITASELVVISQASCVQFCLGSIEGSVYNWFVVSTS